MNTRIDTTSPAEPAMPENLLLSVRKARGWSQRQMADHLGIRQNSVSRIERGKHPISGPLRIVLNHMLRQQEQLARSSRTVKVTLCDADRIEQSVLNFVVRQDIDHLREAASLRGNRLRAVLSKAMAFDHLTEEQRCDPIAIDLALSIADDLREARSPVLRENPFPEIAGRAEREIAEAYCEWLYQEHTRVSLQLYPTTGGAYGLTPCNTLASDFHYPVGGRWQDVPPPSERAAAVLELVGIDLSDAGRIPSGAEYDAAKEISQ